MKKSLFTPILFFGFIFPSIAQDISQLFEKVSHSVVMINTTEKQIIGGGAHKEVVTSDGIGSGILISEDGMILTAAHVVQTAEKMEVSFEDGQKIPAKIISSEPLADVAIIKLMWPPKNPVVAKIGNSDLVKTGDKYL